MGVSGSRRTADIPATLQGAEQTQCQRSQLCASADTGFGRREGTSQPGSTPSWPFHLQMLALQWYRHPSRAFEHHVPAAVAHFFRSM